MRGVSPDTIGAAKWYFRVTRVLLEMARGGGPPEPFSWPRALKVLRDGFFPTSYLTYGLDGRDASDYLSNQDRERTWVLNWPMAGLIDDKIGSYFMLTTLGAPAPRVWGGVFHGRVQAFHDAEPSGSPAVLRAELERAGRLILKPNFGGGGAGILLLEHADGRYRLNGDDVTWAAVEDRLATLREYLISEFVEQAKYARTIFPGSANTIRMLVMHDEDGPFVATAVHRFGRAASGPVDNWSHGGLSARVDLDTGRLGPGVSFPESGQLVWHDHHPDTGAPIAGVAVAHWDAVKDGLLRFARKAPFLPYVGWDVVVTDDGFRILEGNKFSEVNILQVHGPLLERPRVRAFYERNGIVAVAEPEGASAEASGRRRTLRLPLPTRGATANGSAPASTSAVRGG